MASNSIPHKYCARCKKTKPCADFNRNRSASTNYASYCRECAQRIQRQWLSEQPSTPPRKQGSKTCRVCQREKSVTLFTAHKLCKDGRESRCKDCTAQYKRGVRQTEAARLRSKKRREAEKSRPDYFRVQRDRKLRHTYGMTLEDYETMLRAQDGGCALCGARPEERMLVVDHDHATGKVRGLLCRSHNAALGQFFDSVELLERAKQYLLTHRSVA